MKKCRILVIDDEEQIQKLLNITLKSHDFEVLQAQGGKEGLDLASHIPPDVILLDLGLPDMNGHDVLVKLRNWFTNPVIILSVQNREEDIVKALDNGANDYLTKPFRTGELLARIRSSMRKHDSVPSTYISPDGSLEVDFSNHSIKRNQEHIKLTATEFNLIALLIKNEGRVLTHQHLLKAVWGPGYINQTQYLRVFIAQLRKKIEEEPNHPKYILTESGVGYRFISSEQN